MSEKLVNFTVQVNDSEALALSQFLKRVGWAEMRQNSLDEEETYLVRFALNRVRDALAEIGYEPR